MQSWPTVSDGRVVPREPTSKLTPQVLSGQSMINDVPVENIEQALRPTVRPVRKGAIKVEHEQLRHRQPRIVAQLTQPARRTSGGTYELRHSAGPKSYVGRLSTVGVKCDRVRQVAELPNSFRLEGEVEDGVRHVCFA